MIENPTGQPRTQKLEILINNRSLKIYIALIGALALISLSDLIIQTFSIKMQEGEYSSVLIVLIFLSLIFWIGLTVLFFMIGRIQKAIAIILSFLVESGFIWLAILGLASYVLLLMQIENWLLNGVHVISINSTVSVIFTILFFSYWSFPYYASHIRTIVSTKILTSAPANLHQYQPNHHATIVLGILIFIHTAVAGIFAKFTPLFCDEASTFWLFSRSPIAALTRYDTPNNHLLNSILVFISTTIFGSEETGIRLFPLVAGILALIACYALTKKIFDSYVATISLGLAASSSWMLYYSYQARGYVYIYLFSSLAVLGLFLTFRPEHTWRGWFLFIASMSLAFMAMPTTAYIWLSLLIFGGGVYFLRTKINLQLHSMWVKEFLISMGGILVFAGITYLNPLLYLFRYDKLTKNFFSFPEIQPQSTLDLLTQFLANTIFGGNEISPPHPHWMSYVIIVGMAAGFIALVIRKRYIILSLYGCLIIVPLLISLLQHPLPFPRNLIYLLPFLFCLSAYGLYSCGIPLLSILFKKSKRRWQLGTRGFMIAAGTFFIFGFMLSDSLITMIKSLQIYHYQRWPAQQITQYLEQNARPDDGIVAGSCLDYMVAYSIKPQYHITTVLEWWDTGTPAADRIFAIPSQTDVTRAVEFTNRVCSNYSTRAVVATAGDKSIYLCENQ